MSKHRLRRLGVVALLVFGGGLVFQTGAPSCGTLAATTLVSSINFCAILDCQAGFLGGVISPCGSPTTTADDLLADCQNFADADTP
ncbi:MAG: hypothetical protein JSU68_09890 [Phycisphaerales bacterium]|nr:MAG: hypothetical protein JSU68_09890 [Phycisphaerales bacterium]